MCEPFHSVVQYPVDEDDGNGTGGSVNNETKLRSGLGRIFDWGKKITSWFHFSKLGSGHTESIEWSKTKDVYLPKHDIRYEGAWWNRSFKIDGYDAGEHRLESLAAARQYSDVTCMGNIQIFRRYFETSLNKTDHFMKHVNVFIENMLTVKAREDIFKRMKQCFRVSRNIQRNPQAVKLVMGYTRKRENLVSEWSDVPSLWLPSSGSQP